MDGARVEAALMGGVRDYECDDVPSADAAIARARKRAPDLVVLGAGADAPAFAEALLDEPATESVPSVVWGRVDDSSAARLVALGARLVESGRDALLKACDELLDAREGRTIRVELPSPVAFDDGGGGDDGAVVDPRGRRALIADDEPAIVWFLSDVLKSAGWEVEEAPDGLRALDAARRSTPDLVLSDLRMPGLDGVGLCRALRADPILADVPVVLLSWKADWLDSMREAGAVACLLKRSAPEDVLTCVRDALLPHVKLERRMNDGSAGAVRGRLIGTSPYRVLRLACASRPDARVAVRDRGCLYEVCLRDGAPRSATALSQDGTLLRGRAAFEAMLAVRAGRFTVVAEHGPVAADLQGSLYDLVAPSIEASRAPEPPPVRAPLVTEPVALTAHATAPTFARRPVDDRTTAPIASTLPLALGARRPAAATQRLASSRGPDEAPVTATAAPRPRSSRASLAAFSERSGRLRWASVAAIAALGIALGAGARALRHADAPPPAPSRIVGSLDRAQATSPLP